MPAHRFSYQLFNGPIPPGYHIDHLCCVRNCVNPAHLEAVTQGENTRPQPPRKRMNELNARARAEGLTYKEWSARLHARYKQTVER